MFLEKPIFSKSTYLFFFSLLGIVYFIGLFVPLMDNDSAHHADIALRMYLTGDYVTLADARGDYLDKPHLLFWLAALSYKIFGVTTFAYKLPSFLFTVLGTYSTFRLGKLLYNTETGNLAALIVATAFSYVLANNDVRMDAMLTACVVFSTWQLIAFIQTRKYINVFGAAIGLAAGFSTKGHIAVFVPAVAVLFYLFYQKNLKIIFNIKWLLMLLLFALFIAPVVYCYYLQFNLHPEKTVRGKDHINGVKFILFNQSIERFGGEMGNDAKHDYFFFLHSFLWAFAPWSIIAYWAVISRLKEFTKRKYEWLTIGTFLTMLLVISLSGFKLPHYLNIIFPTTAILTAAFLLQNKTKPKWGTTIFIIQTFIVVVLSLATIILNAWAFPVQSFILIVCSMLLLSVVFYFYLSQPLQKIQKAIGASVAAVILVFFLLNSNFYPALLTYQAGKGIADSTRGKVNPKEVYFWKDTYSSSYHFYSASLHQTFTDSTLKLGEKKWLAFDKQDEAEIKKHGYILGKHFELPDYEVTKLTLKFLNPEKRASECTQFVLAEISR